MEKFPSFKAQKRKLEEARRPTPRPVVVHSGVDDFSIGWSSNPFVCRVTHKVLFVTHTKGKVLVINLMDHAGKEVRMVAWNEKIDRHINKFMTGKIYRISGFTVGPNINDYSRIPHTRVFSLSNVTNVLELNPNTLGNFETFPVLVFNYSSLRDFVPVAEGSVYDIVALYRKRKEKEELFEKYTKKYNTIQLIDQFNKKVEIVCDPIQQFFETNPLVSMHTIVGLKGLRIKTMDPLVFISFSDTIIELDPACNIAKEIKTWMAAEEEST